MKRNLGFIDDLTSEICKIRGIDLPPVAVKLLILTYMMYCCNTFNIKYQNEERQLKRPNSGCIIFCQKGTGKSRVVKILKDVFSCVEEERKKIYKLFLKKLIHDEVGFAIPDSEVAKLEKEHMEKFGNKPLSIISDTSTAKALCESFSDVKQTGLNNLLFSIDEAGERVFKEGFGKYGSMGAKEFITAIYQLFDGYMGMSRSSTAKKEGITSQEDVGANFIFVSTAEFLKEPAVNTAFQTALASGLARRFLYLNCPMIDKKNSSRKRYFPEFDRFKQYAKSIYSEALDTWAGQTIKISEDLWEELEKENSDIIIDDEFLLILWCLPLVAWTAEKKDIVNECIEIQRYHWEYITQLYHDLKEVSRTIFRKNTTVYDKICDYVEQQIEVLPEKLKEKNRISIALVKDFCLQNKFCQYKEFSSWFSNLLKDFAGSNCTPKLLEKSQYHVWTTNNYSYEETI